MSCLPPVKILWRYVKLCASACGLSSSRVANGGHMTKADLVDLLSYTSMKSYLETALMLLDLMLSPEEINPIP